MVADVKNNLNEIIQTCRTMQVKSLYLVGSGAREKDYGYSSDLDFLFEFIKPLKEAPQMEFDYFDFLWRLEEITGRKVDLIAAERIRNKYFLESIMKDRVRLYEA